MLAAPSCNARIWQSLAQIIERFRGNQWVLFATLVFMFATFAGKFDILSDGWSTPVVAFRLKPDVGKDGKEVERKWDVYDVMDRMREYRLKFHFALFPVTEMFPVTGIATQWGLLYHAHVHFKGNINTYTSTRKRVS